MTTRVALIQLDSGNDRAANLAEIEHWVLAAAQDGAQLIITPEYSDVRGDAALLQQQASPVPGVVTEHMASLARRTGCWIQLGSMHERLADDPRLGNTSLVFNPDGQIAASYRKTHLYDAVVNGMPYLESDDFAPGAALTTVEAAGLQLGLSICYDIRFAELFRALRSRGANVLVVPAAFNVHTGRDHWEVLLRARAIENQCYVLAAAQIGGPGPALPGPQHDHRPLGHRTGLHARPARLYLRRPGPDARHHAARQAASLVAPPWRPVSHQPLSRTPDAARIPLFSHPRPARALLPGEPS
ncbi:carbon-nitrogen hydrolase family protein [Pseudomonas sp. S 311-6]|uniref:nitrilase-related carbon-nitrogen hydrolase n=1 Tax=Kerstersia gyiorum TaxID=206506 RepID=UPI002097204A|nr:carbon-nitrogen hydrolase family protein [Pseudomonas sp. S 311-6]